MIAFLFGSYSDDRIKRVPLLDRLPVRSPPTSTVRGNERGTAGDRITASGSVCNAASSSADTRDTAERILLTRLKHGPSRFRLREPGANQADVLVYCSASTIYHQMFPIPWVIFPCDHVCPCRQGRARIICRPPLDSPPMLLNGRTRDFDLQSPDSSAFRHIQPSITSHPKRIDRIRDHGSAKPEIILGNSIGYPRAAGQSS
jgi:hypothetical protein